MRLSMEHERLVRMLKESISLMCKSSLSYDMELNVEGLLGITLDKKDIFLVNIKESFQSGNLPPESAATSDTPKKSSRDVIEVKAEDEHQPPSAKRRRHRRRSRNSPDLQQNESFGADFELPDFSADHLGDCSSSTSSRNKHSSASKVGIHSDNTTEIDPSGDTSASGQLDFGEIIIKEEVDADDRRNANVREVDLVGGFDSEPPYSDLAGPSTSTTEELQMQSMYSSEGTLPPGQEVSLSGQVSQSMSSLSPSQHSLGSQGLSAQKQCHHCGWRFPTSGELQKHLNWHHGREYTCKFCGKQFPTSYTLRRHIGGVHQKLKFVCDKCNKAFSQQDNLRVHQKISCFGKS